jgi:hypothetical protein
MAVTISIRTKLLAAPEVTALVGDRIFADGELPQGTAYPALVLTQISAVPVRDLLKTTRHSRCRIQLECWAATRTEAIAVVAAARRALDYQPLGDAEGWTIGPAKIRNIRNIPSFYSNLRGRSFDLDLIASKGVVIILQIVTHNGETVTHNGEDVTYYG